MYVMFMATSTRRQSFSIGRRLGKKLFMLNWGESYHRCYTTRAMHNRIFMSRCKVNVLEIHGRAFWGRPSIHDGVLEIDSRTLSR